MSRERSSALAPVSSPSDVAASGIRRKSLSPISSSNARAAASLCAEAAPVEDAAVEDAAVEAVDPGSRLQADISGSVAVDASVAMAWRRVNKESNNGSSVGQ
jgi:hypothetical protein